MAKINLCSPIQLLRALRQKMHIPQILHSTCSQVTASRIWIKLVPAVPISINQNQKATVMLVTFLW